MKEESTEPQVSQPPQRPQTSQPLRDESVSSSSSDSHAPDGAADQAPAPRPQVSSLPNYLLDPRPIVLVGTLAWTLALLAHMLMFEVDMRTVILCAVGVGVGAVGTAVYALQRRAVIRGTKGAQVGLDFSKD